MLVQALVYLLRQSEYPEQLQEEQLHADIPVFGVFYPVPDSLEHPADELHILLLMVLHVLLEVEQTEHRLYLLEVAEAQLALVDKLEELNESNFIAFLEAVEHPIEGDRLLTSFQNILQKRVEESTELAQETPDDNFLVDLQLKDTGLDYPIQHGYAVLQLGLPSLFRVGLQQLQ